MEQDHKKILGCIGIDPNTKDKGIGCSGISIINGKQEIVIGSGYKEGSVIFRSLTTIHPIDQILVLVEGQYIPDKAGWLQQQKILKLSRSAGRWEQIANDYGIPEDNIKEAYPSAWMKAIVGNLGEAYTKKKMNDLLDQILKAQFPILQDQKLNEHQLHSAGIALYGIRLNHGYIMK